MMTSPDTFAVRQVTPVELVGPGANTVTAQDRRVRLQSGPVSPGVVLGSRKAIVDGHGEWRIIGRRESRLVDEGHSTLVTARHADKADSGPTVTVRRDNSTTQHGPQETIQMQVAVGELSDSGGRPLALLTIQHKLSIPKSRAGNQYASLEGEVRVDNAIDLGVLVMALWLTAGSKWARRTPWVGVRHVPPREDSRGP